MPYDSRLTPQEKQEQYDARRTVHPHFTPAQARAALNYLDAKLETEALGTTMAYFIRELRDSMGGAA